MQACNVAIRISLQALPGLLPSAKESPGVPTFLIERRRKTMRPCGSTVRLGLGVVLLRAGLATSEQGFALGVGTGSVGGEHGTKLRLQGTVMCVDCFLNEVQEEQPTKAETFTQLSQGQEQMVLQVRDISAPPGERAFAWPPPQLRVRSAGRLVDTPSAAAQQEKTVTISGLLHPDQTLEVTAIALSG
jgi:hypothetical protein